MEIDIKTESTPATTNYTPRVFRNDSPPAQQLAEIREYCLSLTAWRLEDSQLISNLRRKVRELERLFKEKGIPFGAGIRSIVYEWLKQNL